MIYCVNQSWTQAHKSQLFLKTKSISPSEPIHALLGIERAGGQNVPYLGYIGVGVTFPQTITGKEEELVALALVVPDGHFNSLVAFSLKLL